MRLLRAAGATTKVHLISGSNHEYNVVKSPVYVYQWRKYKYEEKRERNKGNKKNRGGVYVWASAVVAVAVQQQRGLILKLYSISGN